MSYFRKGHRLGKNLSVKNEDVSGEPYVDLEQEAAYDITHFKIAIFNRTF